MRLLVVLASATACRQLIGFETPVRGDAAGTIDEGGVAVSSQGMLVIGGGSAGESALVSSRRNPRPTRSILTTRARSRR